MKWSTSGHIVFNVVEAQPIVMHPATHPAKLIQPKP